MCCELCDYKNAMLLSSYVYFFPFKIHLCILRSFDFALSCAFLVTSRQKASAAWVCREWLPLMCLQRTETQGQAAILGLVMNHFYVVVALICVGNYYEITDPPKHCG